MEPPYLYRGAVTYVMEGDRYDVVIDTGFFLTLRVPVKLAGLAIPQLKGQAPGGKSFSTAQAAKDLAMQVLLNRWVLVETIKEGKHPRVWAAKIYLDAVSTREGVMKEVQGQQVLDFSAFMNSLRSENFDPRKAGLTYAVRTERSRATFQKGG